MKLTLSPDHLRAALAAPARVAPTKGVLPALACVLLDATDGNLGLYATDLSTAVSTFCNATVEEDGRVAVPARLLAETIAALPNEPLSLSTSGKRLQLSCAGVTASLATLDASEVPPAATATDASVSLDAATLREALGRVVYAAAKDDSRPVLAGGLLDVDGGSLTLTAADGFRLAQATVGLLVPAPTPLRAIVPATALWEVARLLPTDGDAPATVSVGDSACVVTYAGTTITTRLIDGAFPDVARVIPRDCATTLTVPTGVLLAAVKQTAVVAPSDDFAVRLALGEGGVDLTSAASELGSVEAHVDGAVTGPPVLLSLNARYLSASLDRLGSTVCVLGASAAGKPILLRADGDQRTLAVLMPQVLQGKGTS